MCGRDVMMEEVKSAPDSYPCQWNQMQEGGGSGIDFPFVELLLFFF